MPARRMSRAERLVKIEQLLVHHPEGMRVVEIAHVCRVDRRTIYRDLEALERSGAPLRQDDGRYSLIREQYLTTLRLNFHEATALLLSARLLACGASRRDSHLASALDRLGEAFSEPLASQALSLAAKVRDLPDDPGYSGVLEAVLLAWLQRRKVRLWHALPDGEEPTFYDLLPQDVEPGAPDEMRVVGREDTSGEIRAIDLRQVGRAQVLDEAGESITPG